MAERTWCQDPQRLREASGLPFTFATDYKRKKCERAATDEKALAKTLGCIISYEELLIDELKYPDNVTFVGPKSQVPTSRAVTKLTHRLGEPAGQTIVEAFMNGNGVTFEFVFGVRPERQAFKVAGFALHWEVVE